MKILHTIILLIALTSALSAQCGGNGGNAGLETSPLAIGTTITVSVSGNPGAAWTLFLSGSTANITIPGFGTVCINPFDPAFGEFLSGTIPASGRQDIPIAIPPDPALLAVVVYLQAVVVDAGHPSGLGLSRAVRASFDLPDSWVTLSPLSTPRGFATANLAGDGRVLIAGGGSGTLSQTNLVGTNTTDIYDPLDRSVTPGPVMSVNRALHTGTTLQNGRVLVCGGVVTAVGALTSSCEIFDPVSNSFLPAASMGAMRAGHEATLLDDGKVLVTGGTSIIGNPGGSLGVALNAALDTGEVYDPAMNTWTPVSNTMQDKRLGFASVKLADGRVLLISGINGASSFLQQDIPTYAASCDYYDPTTNSFATAPSFGSAQARGAHRAVLHSASGNVFVVGGFLNQLLFIPTSQSSTRIFDGVAWSAGPTLPTGVSFSVAVLQKNGKVHVSGGSTGSLLAPSATADCVTFDGTASFQGKAPIPLSTGTHVAVTLADGQILVAGGAGAAGSAIAAVQLYTPDP